MASAAFDQALLNEIETTLEALLPGTGHDQPKGLRRVAEAIRYSALSGGKRLRPCLAVYTADLFTVPRQRALRAGAAVEMIHCYSLIHDDLPAMDDSDLRRGRPSSHRQFDEATAILAGDALLTEAFAVLAADATHPDASVRVRLVSALAVAAGHDGMVGGQMMDILADKGEGGSLDITLLQSLKTGAMIRVACRFGGYLGQADEVQVKALDDYASRLGLAFQITDDLLDLTATEEDAGKPVGQDAGKLTFVDLLGEEGARRKASSLIGEAKDLLAGLPGQTGPLAAIADFILARRH